MNSKALLTAILILIFLCPAAGGAEKKSLFGSAGKSDGRRAEQPLRITSQQLEADNKNQVIIFKGKVVARQAEVTLYADVAHVYYERKEEGNEIREIVATGNVKMQQEDRLATGQKAVFTNADQKIVLTGDPKVWQGKDMVSGEKIIVLLDEDKSYVESGPEQKVEVVLYPKGDSRKKK
jgi:lipopolysaccharide export system protein LptA